MMVHLMSPTALPRCSPNGGGVFFKKKGIRVHLAEQTIIGAARTDIITPSSEIILTNLRVDSFY
jgi:hypothetical protein